MYTNDYTLINVHDVYVYIYIFIYIYIHVVRNVHIYIYIMNLCISMYIYIYVYTYQIYINIHDTSTVITNNSDAPYVGMAMDPKRKNMPAFRDGPRIAAATHQAKVKPFAQHCWGFPVLSAGEFWGDTWRKTHHMFCWHHTLSKHHGFVQELGMPAWLVSSERDMININFNILFFFCSTPDTEKSRQNVNSTGVPSGLTSLAMKRS